MTTMTSNRTWAECLQAWEKCKEDLRTSSNNVVRSVIYPPVARGVRVPMVGICLSISEYQRFKREGRNLDEIMGYCESGNDVHEEVRRAKNMGIINSIGLTTPRKGFYEVRSIQGDNLICYYNHCRGDEFMPETVEISKKAFYNKASVGPKYHDIKTGDIVQVKDTNLVELTYQGSPYSTYKVEWNICPR